MGRHGPVSRKPALVVLIVWLVLAWIGLVAWQVAEHSAACQVHRENLVRIGKTSCHVLEAAISSMGRGRRAQPQFLNLVLEGIISIPEIKGSWLEELDGERLASTALPENLDIPSTDSEVTWFENGLIVSQAIDISSCPPQQGGGGMRRSSESHVVNLFLYLDRQKLDAEISTDKTVRISIAAGAALLLSGFYLLFWNRGKSKSLRIALEAEKEKAQRNKDWALLGAGLAHETKNPISVIRGLAQQLSEKESISAEDHEEAGRIVDEVDRIVERIDEFLQFSRPVEPNLTAVDLFDLFKDMESLIRPDLSSHKGNFVIECERVAVKADGNMFRQILLNILVNAAHSLDVEGTIELTGSISEDATVLIEVRDDGAGIPSNEIDKIYEPYFTRTEGGTGLGLAIVKRLAEAHEWNIEIKSELHCGTSVIISNIKQAES